MERRELIRMIAAVTGAVVIGADFFVSGCKVADKKTGNEFSAADIELLDEIGETILPATDTPGAKAAEVGKFAALIITDCYTDRQHAVIKEGLAAIDARSKKINGKSFLESSPEQRHALLVMLEKEAKDADALTEKANREKRDIHEQTNAKLAWKEQKEFVNDPPHYYTLIKQLTLWGYFSSKPGTTQALRHVPVPGKYDGNYDYKKGDRAFS